VNWFMGLAIASLGFAIASASSAAESGDAARLRELEARLEHSLRVIDQLQARVEQLESAMARRDSAVASIPADATRTARIEVLEQQIGQLANGLGMRNADVGIPIHGFADVGLRHSNESNRAYGNGRKGFNVGTLDFYLSMPFGERARMLVESALEVERDGATAVDLERLQIGYDIGESRTAWLGRFHTPFGYWNTAFHHGAQLQTAVQRPRFLDFEDKGGVLPVHTTGAWLTGAQALDGYRLGYDLYAGNAQRIQTDSADPVGPGGIATGSLDMMMSGSASARNTVGFNAWATATRLPGLRLGAHGIRGDIAAMRGDDEVLARARLQMFGGYGVYDSDDWEVIAEYYRFDNRDIDGGTGAHRSSAWFAQVARGAGRFTPYARVERAVLNQRDPYFAFQSNGRSYDRLALGLRFDVDPRSAIKLEINQTRKRDLVDAVTGVPVASNSYAEGALQYAVRF
jgi:hypothetical protein